MRIIKPMVIVEDDLDMVMPNGLTVAQHMAKKIEHFARKCYKSEGKMTDESYKTFLQGLFQTRRHTGIAEHRMISVTFITDRGVSHEGLRHRMAAPYLFDRPSPIEAGEDAWLQESTRYCDYGEGDKSKGMTFILPPWVPSPDYSFERLIVELEYDSERYEMHRHLGWRPEEARYWLPQGVKTEYVASKNLGSWWNWGLKRSDEAAHPQMRQLAIPLLRYLRHHFPMFFSSIPATIDDGAGRFMHKGRWYDEATLVVNPYYDQVAFEEVYSR